MASSLPRMNWPAECAAIIPCLNESAAISALVAAVRRHLPTVFVIDDGSTDDTASLARNAGAEVRRHAWPQGKGAALQAGWQLARERGFKWAIALDGDGQHAPGDIAAFLACAETTSAELVIGNRMVDQKKMPWLRRAVNRWMSARISNLAAQSLPDSQCGFRLMDLDAWAALPIDAAHFEIESDVLLSFARAGRRIEFVPVEVIYRMERSKIHPWRDTVRWFRWWRRVRRFQTVSVARGLEAGTIIVKTLQR
jgi:glycosyltransferase involved in cell wall biosynthesis